VIHVVHGIRTGWKATRPNETLLELGVDKDAAVKEGAVGGGMGVLPTTEMAEAARAMITSSASRKVMSVPANKGLAGGNDGSSNRSEGVCDTLMWGQRA
jgi:hypothetical protein